MLFLIAVPILLMPKCEISVYSDYFHGRRTASGTRFSQMDYTCAVNRGNLKRFPFGTRVTLHYKGKQVTVTVTDTGSYKPKKSDQWFDLSKAAMRKLLGENYYTRVVGTWKLQKNNSNNSKN